MQLKRWLLTPLLFAQMWVGVGVLPLKADTVQEKATSVTLRVSQTEAVIDPEIENKNVLALCLFSLLISIVYFGKKYFISNRVFLKIKKEYIRQYFKEYFLSRSFSKSQNAYYWHFYSALNLIKSA